MPEVLVAPDAETLIVQYLTGELATRAPYTQVKAYTNVPNPRPAMWVRVLRTGGTRDFIIDRPSITLEAWAETGVAAMSLMQLVRGLMHAIDQVTYGGATHQFYDPEEFSGPANLPDPESGQERYTETFSVGVRATAL